MKYVPFFVLLFKNDAIIFVGLLEGLQKYLGKIESCYGWWKMSLNEVKYGIGVVGPKMCYLFDRCHPIKPLRQYIYLAPQMSAGQDLNVIVRDEKKRTPCTYHTKRLFLANIYISSGIRSHMVRSVLVHISI